jgi:diketogulonate reductase-like aldo/keto reductase
MRGMIGMSKQSSQSVELHNGVKMPRLGLGVWKTKDGAEVIHAVKSAIEAGYRSIDTAALYGNEEGVGIAIKECGVAREELFITTKVWNSSQGYDSTLQAFEESRRKLNIDMVDLYLVHWPVKGKYKETWRALEQLYKDGAVRAIGVSNFQVHHLEDVIADSEIVPMVNQIELHPRLSQVKLRNFCQAQAKRIQVEAWSPLMQGNLDIPVLSRLAAKHSKTPAQIVLRWEIQNDIVVIPKSVSANRIQENAAIFDFNLTAEDMADLDSLNEDYRFGGDPDNFNF